MPSFGLPPTSRNSDDTVSQTAGIGEAGDAMRNMPKQDNAVLVVFGKHLASLRTKRGLSQSGLARRMKTSQSAISLFESGERNPTFVMLFALSVALEVPIAKLVQFEPHLRYPIV